jgi:hypothetical protein
MCVHFLLQLPELFKYISSSHLTFDIHLLRFSYLDLNSPKGFLYICVTATNMIVKILYSIQCLGS